MTESGKSWNGRVAIWILVLAVVSQIVGTVWLIKGVDVKASFAYDFTQENKYLQSRVLANEKQVGELSDIRIQLADIKTKLAIVEYKVDQLVK